MEINQDAIQRAIVNDVVDRIFGEGDVLADVDREVTKRIDAIFAETVETLIQEKIESVVKSGFDREYRKVDAFGRPESEPTTISKELDRMISTYWSQKVDRNGKPTDNTFSSVTRAEWMMVKICGEDFHQHLKQESVNVTAHLKDSLRDELRKWTDDTLHSLFRVKSQQDKAEGRNY